MSAQFATDKYGLRIWTPGTGQIYFRGFRFSGELAVVKDIAVFFSFVGRRGGHIAVTLAMDMAAVEDSGRPAENKINGSFDVAVFVILAALFAVSVEGVLET